MLTDSQIKNLRVSNKLKRIADRDGLCVEKWPSSPRKPFGTTRFIFRFQINKKPQTIVIGKYPDISLSQARKLAADFRIIINKGGDPRTHRNKEKEQKLTLKAVAEKWYEKNCKHLRVKTQKTHRRSLERDIYPTIGDIAIVDIKRMDLLKIIHPHEELGHHEIAHRLLARLKSIFDYALAAGLTENYPLNGIKKALAVKPKIKNHASINPAEAHQLLHAVRQCKARKIVKLYIELLAHLLVRPSELRLAQWNEVDLQKAEWHIPAHRMKMDEPHWVPLSSEAVQLLREIRLMTGFTPYLFNSPCSRKQQPISEACARKWLHRLGYKDRHCLHGFRSLASTVLNSETNFRADAIEVQQARKVQGVRGIYMRADFKQERRRMMTWYSQWLSQHPSQYNAHVKENKENG